MTNNIAVEGSNNFNKIRGTSTIPQMAKVLVNFWCTRCEFSEGKVPECEQVCSDTIQQWLKRRHKI